MALREVLSAAPDYGACVTEIAWETRPPTPLLRAVLAYWNERRGARFMPSRGDLDPLHIPTLLPQLMLLDVLKGPLDFRYRLVGTAIVDRLGRDNTGLRFSELALNRALSREAHFARAIVEERRPGWACLELHGPGRALSTATIVGMPLADDDKSVKMLFCAVDFSFGDGSDVAR
jgi:hypothetical protein